MRLSSVRTRGALVGLLLTAAVTPAAAHAGATHRHVPPGASPGAGRGIRPRQDTTRMSDANILAQEIGGDSAEVAIARFVAGQRTSAAVRAYAAMLVGDHTKSMGKTRSLARRLGVTPVPPPNDTTAQETAHVLERFRTLQGRALDTAFVHHEVTDHEHDIADAHRMEAAARDPRVKALVRRSVPELQKHLDRARQLAS